VLSPRVSYPSSAEKIRQSSLKKYGRPQEEVEQEIRDRLKWFRGDSRSQVETSESLLLNQPWLKPYNVSEQGILTGGNNKFDIGVVIATHLEKNPEVLLLVKKSSRADYEFSDMWTLPGGIVHPVLQKSVIDYLKDSLSRRLEAETSLNIKEWGLVSLMNLIPPPLTSYNINGQKNLFITFFGGREK
jgi:hypothetical protein